MRTNLLQLMTADLVSTRFRLGLCFRRRAGAEVGADKTGTTVVVTGLTTVVVTAGPVAAELPVDVEAPVEVELLPEEPVCELLRCGAAALLDGAVMLAKSAGERRLSVARYSRAPF